MTSAQLIEAYENCRRKAKWFTEVEPTKLRSREFVAAGVRHGLMSSRKDFNVAAGESVVEMASKNEMIVTGAQQFDAVMHCATISDIVTAALRNPKSGPWQAAPRLRLGETSFWDTDALLEPNAGHLRRVEFVSNWDEDRHYSLCRSWSNLGLTCIAGEPLQIAVIVLGQFRDGKYRSPWTQAFTHPSNLGIRFRKKNAVRAGFKDTWGKIWREDHEEHTTQAWLQQMVSDGVLHDICFKIDLPVPQKEARQQIIDLAQRQLEAIYSMRELPERQLSTCDWPVPCIFRDPCHKGDLPKGRYGFVKIEE